MKIEYLNPPSLCPTHGWTHVVSVSNGRTIHVSGQVSVNERGEVVGRGDLSAQTEQAFKNIEQALAAAGAKFQDVIKMNLYVVGPAARARAANPRRPRELCECRTSASQHTGRGLRARGAGLAD